MGAEFGDAQGRDMVALGFKASDGLFEEMPMFLTGEGEGEKDIALGQPIGNRLVVGLLRREAGRHDADVVEVVP